MTSINAIKEKHGYSFTFQSASKNYEASGCGGDWAKAIAKINHSFIIELQPREQASHYVFNSHFPISGFLYPEEKLEEACATAYTGFIEYIRTFLDVVSIDLEVTKDCKKKLETILTNNIA